ncbi:amidohydrolase family protein [Phreatobacter sp.]|uniref:amidohydrolase family protein n=1 Tax=Phreatobacter sp. TaxID=1966341 RepID=UPI003F71634F
MLIVEGRHILEGFAPDGAAIVHRDAGLLVEDGRVLAIGPAGDMARRAPDARRIGGPDVVVVPGLINAHHHVGSTPFQLGSPDHPLELWFASRLGLRDVNLRLDTLVSAFEMIASGVTTVQHLHSRAPGSPDDVVRAAEEVIGAYREIGMRVSYSMALRDQNRLVYEADEAFIARLPEALRPAMADYFRRFTLSLEQQVGIFHALRRMVEGERRVAVQIAPANLHWLSERALETAGELSATTGLPLHMHLVETPYQRAYARRRTGGTAFAHLHHIGLTGERLTIGHGVWMSQDDIHLCAQTGTRICHNCSSNFRLRSGRAPVMRFAAEGIPVALGIDEAGINDDRDMLQEMRLVLAVHRAPGIDTPALSPAEVLRMATQNGAGTTPFGSAIGSLSPGAEADLVLFDWARVTRPYQNPDTAWIDVLVHRARSEAVKTVMIAGEVVYDGGRFTKLDREAVHAELADFFARPATPAEQGRADLARAVFPYVKAFYDGWLSGEDAI